MPSQPVPSPDRGSRVSGRSCAPALPCQGTVLFSQELANTHRSQVFPPPEPQENTFAYLRCRGLAELRCRMPWMCFSKECSDSATMRSGDTARSLSSLVHSRGGDAGWTVLLPHNSTRDSTLRPVKQTRSQLNCYWKRGTPPLWNSCVSAGGSKRSCFSYEVNPAPAGQVKLTPPHPSCLVMAQTSKNHKCPLA